MADSPTQCNHNEFYMKVCSPKLEKIHERIDDVRGRVTGVYIWLAAAAVAIVLAVVGAAWELGGRIKGLEVDASARTDTINDNNMKLREIANRQIEIFGKVERLEAQIPAVVPKK